jgi:uncharacterized delta-60 repeat protein
MTSTIDSMLKRTAVSLAALAALTAAPGTATAAPVVSKAPGRVVFPVASGLALKDTGINNDDPLAAALPDGSIVMVAATTADPFTLYAAKLGPHGALDPSFGTAGIAKLATPSGATFELQQLLRQADGKLLLIGPRDPSSPLGGTSARMEVTRLNADGSLDRGYGAGGSAATPLGESCGRGCTIAALAPDGSLVVSGSTTSATPPPAGTMPDLRWSLTRLTPAGAVDPSFGSAGVVTIPTAGTTFARDVAIGAGGTIVTAGQLGSGSSPGSRLLLTRLTPGGAADATFAGGVPVASTFQPGRTPILLQDDGSVVIAGGIPRVEGPPATEARFLLARYTPAGAPDTAFGTVELKTTPEQLLPAAGGALLAVQRAPANSFGLTPARGGVRISRVTSTGALDPAGPGGSYVDLPFGGGVSAYSGGVPGENPEPPLYQNAFVLPRLVARADGSFVATARLRVTQPADPSVTAKNPTAENPDLTIGRFAVAALTPAFALDPAFGGPVEPLHLSARLARQRARTAVARRAVRVELNASAVGIARVKIVHGGRAIAESQVGVFATGRNTLPVKLTTYGRGYLRHHPRAPLAVTATARDLLTNTARATATGRLR